MKPVIVNSYKLVAKNIAIVDNLRKVIECSLAENESVSLPTYTVELRGLWISSEIVVGDIFNVIDFNDKAHDTIVVSNGSIPYHLLLDDMRGLLVLYPDKLISPTRVADACSCVRRSIVSERIKPLGGGPISSVEDNRVAFKSCTSSSSAAVLGNLKHDFIEILLELYLRRIESRKLTGKGFPSVDDLVSDSEIRQIIARCIRANIEDLLVVGKSDKEVEEILRLLKHAVFAWATSASSSGIRSLAQYQNMPPSVQGAIVYSLEAVESVEESIWCPFLGLKGALDIITRAGLATLPGRGIKEERDTGRGDSRKVRIPLELKTGKWKASQLMGHKAQVILYILIMTMREYAQPSAFHTVDQTRESRQSSLLEVTGESTPPVIASEGLLLYINESETKLEMVSLQWGEVTALLMTRNILAKQLKLATESLSRSFPPMIGSTFQCGYCYQAAECMTYHAALEAGNPASSGVPALFTRVLRDVSPLHMSYLRHWERLLDLEEDAAKKGHRFFWTVPCVSRQDQRSSSSPEAARCAGGFSLTSVSEIGVSNVEHFRRKNESFRAVASVTSNVNICTTESPTDTDDMAAPLRLDEAVTALADVAEDLKDVSDASWVLVFHKSGPAVVSSGKGLSELRSDGGSESAVFNVGDRVIISAEKARGVSYDDLSSSADAVTHPFKAQGIRKRPLASVDPNSPRSQSLSQSESLVVDFISEAPRGAVVDIENCCTRPTASVSMAVQVASAKRRATVLSIEPNICSGIITDISDKEYRLVTTRKPKRLMMLSGTASPRLTFRFDANSMMYSGVSYLRSAVMSLLLDPHDPMSFMQGGPCPSADSLPQHSRKTRLRELIVDLAPPISFPDELLPDDVAMFFPPNLDRRVVRDALAILQQSSTAEGSKHGGGGSGQPTGLGGESHFFGGSLVLHPGCNPVALYAEYSRMNHGQRGAIRAALLSRDYTLLQGFPGSGKSSTVSLLVRALVSRGGTVLLSSYTHSAIDTLLKKLVEAGMRFPTVARIGSGDTVHPDIADLILHSDRMGSIAALSSICTRARIVACTVLLAFRSGLVSSFSFDYCIVDEAGQIVEPAVVGAILKADKFVLIGDHFQLPPLVQSPEAIALGMDVSLFKRLADAHPAAVHCLVTQYRMNADIMSISNTMFYKNRMQCGLPSRGMTASPLLLYQKCLNQSVPIPIFPSTASSSCDRDDWLFLALDPSRCVLFLNTDNIKALCRSAPDADADNVSVEGVGGEKRERGIRTSNQYEADVIHLILLALHRCCHSASQRSIETTAQLNLRNIGVGIIAPYRAQVKTISETLAIASAAFEDLRSSSASETTITHEISTVDKFQGRDMNVVIVSTTVYDPFDEGVPRSGGSVTSSSSASEVAADGDDEDSSARRSAGMTRARELLEDWRRINVALTRARNKLIILGSVRALEALPVWNHVFSVIKPRGWVVDLPSLAVEMYGENLRNA